MLIRKLDKEDASALQACRLLALGESPDEFLVTFDEVADTPVSQVESELLDPDLHYLGAFSGGELVGFMRFIRFQRAARRHVAEVRSVYVKRTRRGQGIGTRLLRQLLQDAGSLGIESLILSVLTSNLPARRLYEACGFKHYGTEARAVRKEHGDLDLALYSLDLRRAK